MSIQFPEDRLEQKLRSAFHHLESAERLLSLTKDIIQSIDSGIKTRLRAPCHIPPYQEDNPKRLI